MEKLHAGSWKDMHLWRGGVMGERSGFYLQELVYSTDDI